MKDDEDILIVLKHRSVGMTTLVMEFLRETDDETGIPERLMRRDPPQHPTETELRATRG